MSESISPMTQGDSLDQLRQKIRSFTAERDWQQFHTPKNLAMALTGEAGELAALFQWLTPQQLPEAQALREEVADVLIYLIQLADATNIDIIDAANQKIAANAQKYPADKARGSAAKYTELTTRLPRCDTDAETLATSPGSQPSE